MCTVKAWSSSTNADGSCASSSSYGWSIPSFSTLEGSRYLGTQTYDESRGQRQPQKLSAGDAQLSPEDENLHIPQELGALPPDALCFRVHAGSLTCSERDQQLQQLCPTVTQSICILHSKLIRLFSEDSWWQTAPPNALLKLGSYRVAPGCLSRIPHITLPARVEQTPLPLACCKVESPALVISLACLTRELSKCWSSREKEVQNSSLVSLNGKEQQREAKNNHHPPLWQASLAPKWLSISTLAVILWLPTFAASCRSVLIISYCAEHSISVLLSTQSRSDLWALTALTKALRYPPNEKLQAANLPKSDELIRTRSSSLCICCLMKGTQRFMVFT